MHEAQQLVCVKALIAIGDKITNKILNKQFRHINLPCERKFENKYDSTSTCIFKVIQLLWGLYDGQKTWKGVSTWEQQIGQKSHLHLDVCFMMYIIVMGGSSHLSLLVDNSSRKMWVYFIFDTFHKFKKVTQASWKAWKEQDEISVYWEIHFKWIQQLLSLSTAFMPFVLQMLNESYTKSLNQATPQDTYSDKKPFVSHFSFSYDCYMHVAKKPLLINYMI